MKFVRLYKFLMRNKHIRKTVGNEIYEIEYQRSPFWVNERQSWKLFIAKKLFWWHGQVWLVYPNGGRCGFDTTCTRKVFPYFRMRKLLNNTSKRINSYRYKERYNGNTGK